LLLTQIATLYEEEKENKPVKKWLAEGRVDNFYIFKKNPPKILRSLKNKYPPLGFKTLKEKFLKKVS
jgi:hypothetical protein